MTCRFHWTISVFLALTSSASSSFARAQGPDPAEGGPVIRGTAFDADSGIPIVGARVEVWQRAANICPKIVPSNVPLGVGETGADGAFSVSLKTAAVLNCLNVSVSRAGFLSERVEVDAGLAQSIRVKLRRFATISGKLLDEHGAPRSRMEVSAVQCCMWTYGNKRDYLKEQASAFTDDRGEYRISGLKPGPYYLVARRERDCEKCVRERPGWTQTFYPGVTETRFATKVTAPSRVETRADFALAAQENFQVRLRVALPPGWAPESVTSTTIQIFPKQLDVPWDWSGDLQFRNAPDQSAVYTSNWLPPGEYDIVAWTRPRPPPGEEPDFSDGAWVFGQLAVKITDHDVDAGTMTLTRGAHLRGRVIDKDQLLPRGRDDAALYMYLRAMDVVAFRHSFGASVGEDGTFAFPNAPKGLYRIELQSEEGYYLSAVMYGGRDVRDSGFRLDGEPEGPLELVISGPPAVVDGVVHNARGEPVPRAYVSLTPPPALRGNWDSFYGAFADETGEFHFRDLRPGEYTAVAWDVDGKDVMDPYYLFVRDYLEPDFPGALSANGVPIHLEAGVTRTIALRAAPKAR
jgi:protocatechuate 3,4-dioxygenase beta subunit